MSFLNGVLGNASTVAQSEITKDINPLLIGEEEIEASFKVIRDLIVFTDKRLIIVDKQGVTGKKTEYHSIPYKSISHFSVETAGNFDLDAELKIWTPGSQSPTVYKSFRKDGSIYDVQKILAAMCI